MIDPDNGYSRRQGIREGGCTCFRCAPCSWCMSLTEEEADALARGSKVLLHALLDQEDQDEEEEEFIMSGKKVRRQKWICPLCMKVTVGPSKPRMDHRCRWCPGCSWKPGRKNQHMVKRVPLVKWKAEQMDAIKPGPAGPASMLLTKAELVDAVVHAANLKPNRFIAIED